MIISGVSSESIAYSLMFLLEFLLGYKVLSCSNRRSIEAEEVRAAN